MLILVYVKSAIEKLETQKERKGGSIEVFAFLRQVPGGRPRCPQERCAKNTNCMTTIGHEFSVLKRSDPFWLLLCG
jgi:hypothetical protein